MMSIPYADNLKASKFAVQSYAALVLARQQKAPLGALREIWSIVQMPLLVYRCCNLALR
ncbi:hypothetical protein ACLK19_16690 [Escherichia coli]